MKRFAVLAVILTALALCAGCGGSLNAQFVKAVDSNWGVMGPGYRDYIQNDAALTAQSKSRRISAVDEFTALVAQAKAKVDE